MSVGRNELPDGLRDARRLHLTVFGQVAVVPTSDHAL
jgi:hypothetical protein